MFGISFPFLTILLIWLVLLYYVYDASRRSRFALGFLPRMSTLLGVVLVMGGFFFQPWLKLSFLSYWIRLPELVEKYMPVKLIGWLVARFGAEWAVLPLEWFEKLTHLKGWQVILLPTYSFGVHLAMLFPLLVALPALLWVSFGAWRPGTRFGAGVGIVLFALSLSSAVVLLLCLAEIDALGFSRHFQGALVVTLLGAHLGNGPWFVLAGLLLLAVGGIIEIVHRLPEIYPEQGGRSEWA